MTWGTRFAMQNRLTNYTKMYQSQRIFGSAPKGNRILPRTWNWTRNEFAAHRQALPLLRMPRHKRSAMLSSNSGLSSMVNAGLFDITRPLKIA